jgi:hypothetical protein
VRRTVLIGVLGLVLGLVVASPADARPADVCGCMVKWANRYASDAGYRVSLARKLAHRGVNARKRRRTKRAIYDWQKDHVHAPGWCSRGRLNRKACEAGIVCITAAGATLLNEGDSARAWRHAVVNCAAAASAVLLSP